MIHFQTERRAIHSTAIIINDYGWTFIEQSVGDIGIDAIVELPIDTNNQVKILGLQIKGGESNFHRTKNSLTFYFSERHYVYWEARSKTHPILIILHDPLTNSIYWQHFRGENVEKTSKHWKIDVPLKNVLDKAAKDKIETLARQAVEDTDRKSSKTTRSSRKEENQSRLQFLYSINKQEKGCLFMTIESPSESFSFSLKYKPEHSNWDRISSKLTWEDNYYYSLQSFEECLQEEYQKLSSDIRTNPLFKIIKLVKEYINDGIEKMAEFIFDHENEKLGIPKYKKFCQAFELHSGLTKEKYQAQAIGYIIHFKTDDGSCFKMDTYEGKKALLKYFIEDRSYDEIYVGTDENIWSKIYIDAGIERSKFIPIMLKEWEIYWGDLYRRIAKDVGHTSHLDKRKEISLRQLNLFFDTYNDSANPIELAYDFDESVMYPLAVLTMMDIFNSDVCYDEYCEFEFFGDTEWESISLDEENDAEPMFFIKPYDL